MGLLHAFTVPVARFFFGFNFSAMVYERTILRGPIPLDQIRVCNGPLRVPTFYSYTKAHRDRVIFALCVSVLFGAIHSVAWFYDFSTSPERWGWRISSIIVSVVPLILSSMFTAIWMGTVKDGSNNFFFLFWNTFLWVYMMSRIALLLFPLIGLRALPPGAYVDLDWATIIPHI